MIKLEEITIIEAPIQRCFDLSRRVEVHLLANISPVGPRPPGT
jgi:hypothetical protein